MPKHRLYGTPTANHVTCFSANYSESMLRLTSQTGPFHLCFSRRTASGEACMAAQNMIHHYLWCTMGDVLFNYFILCTSSNIYRSLVHLDRGHRSSKCPSLLLENRLQLLPEATSTAAIMGEMTAAFHILSIFNHPTIHVDPDQLSELNALKQPLSRWYHIL